MRVTTQNFGPIGSAALSFDNYWIQTDRQTDKQKNKV